MRRNTPLLLLVLLNVAAWGVPVYEIAAFGQASVMSAVTAGMFSLMLLLWPFLNGRRLHGAHVERALVCRDCHALRWPGELDFGFCIHCGSTRTAVSTPS